VADRRHVKATLYNLCPEKCPQHVGASAEEARVSEAALLAATGKYPDEWFAMLDEADATS
jgi:hypothetical protein